MTQIAIHRPCKPQKQSLGTIIRRAVSLKRQRRQLARLDDRALQDIGVSRSEADAEASRFVWDAPEFWQK
ncbi:DUF1127 domain-containing protein [Ruegeria sp. NA]|nr:DUF1127 domain-containing protein [Ruegeria sp. NA]MCX8955293.1 DUF1127 domain-containing protein [Ruegeria sp. NA]